MEDHVNEYTRKRGSAARRVYLADVMASHENESGDRKFEDSSEVKIFGTVLSKNLYKTEGKVEYGVLVISDGSGPTIQIKAWGNDASALDQFEKGELIDVVGKVRQKKDEIFLVPEIVKKLDDPNWRIVRELEIIEDYLRRNKARMRSPFRSDDKERDLRTEIISIIDAKGGNTGIDFTELAKCIKHSNEEEIKKTLNELLDQGTICETRPGRYRK